MPRKYYKLKCFHCGQNFKNKTEVFKGRLGWPICENCCYENIDMDFDDAEQIIEQLKSRFNRNYNRFLKYLTKECKICPECNTYYPKDEFIENICQCCFEIKMDNEKINEVEIKNVN